jgi:hypothetical protein
MACAVPRGMKWVWVVGTVGWTLSTPGVTAAERPDQANARGARETATGSTTPATVPSTPQPREFSRPDAAYEATLAEPPVWYGWQTLSLDGLLLVGGVAMLPLSNSRSDLAETLLWVPVVGFAVGGPAFHVIHREPWRALGSFGLRTGLPVLGGAIGIGLVATCPPAEGDYGNCGLGELIVGAAAGVVAASLIDGLALARESPPSSPHLRLSLTPFISPDGTTRELRLRGSF